MNNEDGKFIGIIFLAVILVAIIGVSIDKAFDWREPQQEAQEEQVQEKPDCEAMFREMYPEYENVICEYIDNSKSFLDECHCKTWEERIVHEPTIFLKETEHLKETPKYCCLGSKPTDCVSANGYVITGFYSDAYDYCKDLNGWTEYVDFKSHVLEVK